MGRQSTDNTSKPSSAVGPQKDLRMEGTDHLGRWVSGSSAKKEAWLKIFKGFD